MMVILEKAKEIPLEGEYDVVVAGGGIAGIAASLAAVRCGAKVLLLERMYLLGGLATSGLIAIYLPLCDGKGHQVSFGLAEELMRLSVSRGCPTPERSGSAWLRGNDPEERKKERFLAQFDPNLFAILIERLLLENGVDILYGTTLTAVQTDGNRISAVITESKSGRQAFTARSFVDATGDADLVYIAREETVELAQGNVLAAWFYEFTSPSLRMKKIGAPDVPEKYRKAEKTSCEEKRYRGLDVREISGMVCDSHEKVLENYLINGDTGADHALASIATIPQLRMTRRIKGLYTLDDTEDKVFFPDSVGLTSDWRKRGPVYELPFRSLIGKAFSNLITCGRIISVTDAMWDISRVIPPCAVTGEAAGTAAALTDDFHGLDIGTLQQKLRNNGVRIHVSEVMENV